MVVQVLEENLVFILLKYLMEAMLEIVNGK